MWLLSHHKKPLRCRPTLCFSFFPSQSLAGQKETKQTASQNEDLATWHISLWLKRPFMLTQFPNSAECWVCHHIFSWGSRSQFNFTGAAFQISDLLIWHGSFCSENLYTEKTFYCRLLVTSYSILQGGLQNLYLQQLGIVNLDFPWQFIFS